MTNALELTEIVLAPNHNGRMVRFIASNHADVPSTQLLPDFYTSSRVCPSTDFYLFTHLLLRAILTIATFWTALL